MRDDIEVSLCLDQGVSDEDVAVDQLEIYVYRSVLHIVHQRKLAIL